MNTQSSRSHSVFTLTLQSKMEKDGITQIQESKLNLVDLAGRKKIFFFFFLKKMLMRILIYLYI